MSQNFRDWVSRYNIQQAPIIHIGAHFVEERNEYREFGFEPVFWVEALPDACAHASQLLAGYKDQHIFNAALFSVSGQQLDFYVAGSEGSSSSLLKPTQIQASHPEVEIHKIITITTSTLDELIGQNANGITFKVIVLDVQGAEIEVLGGAIETLATIEYIISEVSIRRLYKNAPRIKDFVRVVEKLGFSFVESDINRATGWGEALFIRKDLLMLLPGDFPIKNWSGRRFSLGTSLRNVFVFFRIPHRFWYRFRSK
jgi:FkbM family methyltransferase